jgi:hypothetical protein
MKQAISLIETCYNRRTSHVPTSGRSIDAENLEPVQRASGKELAIATTEVEYANRGIAAQRTRNQLECEHMLGARSAGLESRGR